MKENLALMTQNYKHEVSNLAILPLTIYCSCILKMYKLMNVLSYSLHHCLKEHR